MSNVSNSEDIEDALQCPVCWFEYDLNERLPRWLPCHHSVCAYCIGQLLIVNVNVNCPTCRESHLAPRGVLTFPQDSGGLPLVRLMARTPRETPMCQQHGQEIAFCCNECRESLCSQCKNAYHGDHDVSDVLQLKAETSRKIKVDAHNLKSQLEHHKQDLIGTKMMLKQHFEAFNRKLTHTYAEERARIFVDIDKVEETVNELNNISQSYNLATTSYQSLVNRVSAVSQMSTHVKRTMAESSYRYYADAEERNTFTLERYKINLDVVKPLNVANACQLECIVVHHLATTKRVIFGMNPLRHDSVLLWSGDGMHPNLVEYQLNTGREIWTERGGRAGLYLPDTSILAVSYKREGKIGFFSVDDIRAPPPHFVSAQFSPTVMCAAQPGIMFVADWSDTAASIRRLNYNSGQLSEPLVIVNEKDVLDMSYAKLGRKELIILACGEEGLSAYNINNGIKEWNIKGELLEIRNQINVKGLTRREFELFVCDSNNACVHMFSFDGTYLGEVIKEGEHDLGKPGGVRFKENPPSLVITHKKSNCDFWEVSVVEITNPWEEPETPTPNRQFYYMIPKWIYQLFAYIWPFGRYVQN